ncbi:MAG: polyphenol oxidase family protein [Flavonifractor plautii]
MNIIEHNKNGLVYLTADGFEAAGGVAHGFSTRLGGVSEGIYATLNLGMNRGDAPDRVRENYRRFCAAIGADMGNIVCASQVHGDTVRTVTAADLGIGLDEPEPWQADGLVTDIPGVTLAVYSADCLPILLYDPVRRVVGHPRLAGHRPGHRRQGGGAHGGLLRLRPAGHPGRRRPRHLQVLLRDPRGRAQRHD